MELPSKYPWNQYGPLRVESPPCLNQVAQDIIARNRFSIDCIQLISYCADKPESTHALTSMQSSGCKKRAAGPGLVSATKKTCTSFEFKDYNLEKVLMESTEGAVALAYYKANNELTDKYRKYIADSIIRDYLRSDITRDLPQTTEKKFAELILELFPEEVEVMWYRGDHTRDSAQGRGKLLNRFYNMRRELLKLKVVEQPSPGKSTKSRLSDVIREAENVSEAERVAMNDKIQWLKNNKQPWVEVLDFWKDTVLERMTMLHAVDPVTKEVMSTINYLKLFPALADTHSGYILLESDFDHLYPNRSLNLYSEWVKLSAFVRKQLPPSDLEAIDELFSSDGKKVKTLLLISKLFPVATAVKKNRKTWRPSRKECQEGLILIVPRTSDILPTLNLRKKKYEEYGLSFSPQVVLVGDEDNLTECYIYVNNIVYQVDSPLKAFDLTFKAMHALDTEYHKECCREWKFFQRAVYKFEAIGDQLDGHTSLLIKRYEKFSV